jgi:twitching motility protein PilJ
MKLNLNLRALTSLKVRHKLSLIVGLLAIPIFTMAYLIYVDEKAKIDFAVSEDNGLLYLRPLHELIVETAEHRAHTGAFLRGDRTALGRMRQQANKVDELVAAQDKVHAQFGKKLDPKGLWIKMKSEWAELKSEAQGLTLEKSFERHTELVRDMLSHNKEVLADSGLILDPVAETYFLIAVAGKNMPDLLEKIAQLRAEARGVLSKEAMTAEDEIALAEHIALISDELTTIDEDLYVGLKNDPQLKALIDPLLKKFDATTKRLIDDIEELTAEAIQKKQVTHTEESVFEDATRAIDAGLALFHAVDPQLQRLLDERVSAGYRHMAFFLGGGLLIALLAAVFAYFTIIAVTRPLQKLSDTAQKIAAGDKTARAQIITRDEIGELAMQFDIMLDQQVALNDKITAENTQLNESVLNLLQAVAKLAQKDLTTKVPVREDVTGAVSDALNLMTEQTANVLIQVVEVADGVAEAADEVRKGADIAMNGAMDDKIRIEQAAIELTTAAKTMTDIAKLALQSNEAAAKAIATTDKAQETVLGTVQGITAIRDVIRETEKRIKRLGERSQEIGGVVNLINNIAERTHILALNASMHAASAGEAGRGFAVVANEVQRLAENAREATAQISTLVGSIQTETADTVTTMNETISQVVEGTKMAEQAGAQMRETRASTAELVKFVEQINKSSTEQAAVSQQLVKRAGDIEVSSRETLSELQKQSSFVARLVEYSARLVTSVGVFTLPKSERAMKEDMEKTSLNLRKAA